MAVYNKPHVVIDFGSAWIRCGFAGECRPRCVLQSPLFGLPLNLRLQEYLDLLSPFFSSLFVSRLLCKPKERGVVLCEGLVQPRNIRNAVSIILFDYLQIPKVLNVASSSIALYCTGVIDGIVLDIGNKEASIISVLRGIPVYTSFRVLPLGVSAVSNKMKDLLGLSNLSSEQVDNLVASAIVVPSDGYPTAQQLSPISVTLESNKVVTIPSDVRTNAAKVLFGDNADEFNLASLILDCLRQSPIDMRKRLIGRLLVIGGGASLPGICASIAYHIKLLTSQESGNYKWATSCVESLKVLDVPFPRGSVLWVGASIMASLPRLNDHMINSDTFCKNQRVLSDWTSLNFRE